MTKLGAAAELDVVTGSASEVPAQAGVRVHRGVTPQSPALVDLVHQADIFALPSHGDAFGLVVAEAMAAGLPVVATNVGAMPEMVTDGVTGYLVRPGDVRQLAQALSELVRSPSRRAAMGRAGQRVATEEHDAMRNNRAILTLLSEVSTCATRPLQRPA
jgi:glycosyltransferase involved in cell wall biosynthesis